AAVHVQFHRAGSIVGADVEDVAQPAGLHRPLRPGGGGPRAGELRAGKPQRPPGNSGNAVGPPEEPHQMSRELHIVGFQVGRETYGVPITSLHEIVRVPEITAVPDAPDYLE